jgi:hypothetical protein
MKVHCEYFIKGLSQQGRQQQQQQLLVEGVAAKDDSRHITCKTATTGTTGVISTGAAAAVIQWSSPSPSEAVCLALTRNFYIWHSLDEEMSEVEVSDEY